MAVYFFLIIIGIRNNERYNLVQYLVLRPYKNILLEKKPKLLRNSHWLEIRKKAIDLCFVHDYSSNIYGFEFYKFLDSEKSQLVTEEEWKGLTKIAEEKFIENVSKSISSNSIWDGDKFHNLIKPKYCSNNTWKKIVKLITDFILADKILKLSSFPSITKVERLISDKPSIISQKDWDDFKEKIVELSNQLKQEEEIKEIFSKLEFFFRIEKVSDRQGKVSDENWEKLKDFETKTLKIHSKTKENLEKLDELNLELLPIKLKIEKQLKIINDLFVNPESISRIESYSNPFSDGNFEDIKNLAEKLIDKKV